MKYAALLLLAFALAWPDEGLSDAEKAELDQLLERLGNDDWEVRERASMAISNALASGKPIVAFLAERMKSRDLEVRDRIRQLLLNSGHWDASPELLAEKTGAFVKECEGREMVAWYANTQVEPSTNLSDDNARTLSILLRTAEGTRAILDPFPGKGEIYRRNVCWFVATHLPAGAPKFLHQASEDPDDLVRAYAAFGWARLADPANLGTLLMMSTDPNEVVRCAVAVALERFPDPGSLPILIGLLGDEEPMARYHASYSLIVLTGRDGGYNAWYPAERRSAAIEGWKGWWEENKEGWKPRR